MASITEHSHRVSSHDDMQAPVEVDLTAILGVLRRHRRMIITSLVVAVVLALSYLVVATPKYAATASLMVDTRRAQMFQSNSQEQQIPDMVVDAALVESQAETLKSERLAETVIKALGLDKDPEFIGDEPGVIRATIRDALGGLKSLLGLSQPIDEDEATLNQRAAMEAYAKALDVKRVGTSYVIEVTFRAEERAKAAKIANAIAQTYIRDQLDFRSEVMRRASRWLEGRITELRQQASEAESAVQTYRAQNNLIDANGKSITDQQLSELTTQLANARSDGAQAKARLDRIESILDSGVGDASVADTLKNDVIIKLRQQYNDTAKREADWSSRYGPNHTAAVNLRAEMKQTERAIQDELRRIAKTYESDYAISKVREQSLQTQIDELFANVNTGRQAQVKLKELESTAQSYRTMHDTFLQRYVQAVQQQSSPITEARIITVAQPPRDKASPKSLIVLGIALGGGLMFGVAGAFLREALDKRIHTVAEAEVAVGAQCLGILPLIERRDAKSARRSRSAAEVEDTKLPQDKRAVFRDPILTHGVDAPFSQFAETLRSIKVSVDTTVIGGGGRVIGIVSAVPGEGKTTTATNLAMLIAQTGRRVALVDMDLRNPSLTQGLARAPRLGLLDILLQKAELEDVLLTEPGSGLRVLPMVPDRRLFHSNEIISSQAMRELLRTLRGDFDYVILDLPPLGPIVDARAAAQLVDDFAMVVEWNATAAATVSRALATAPAVRDGLLGVVLSKVNLDQYRNFEADGGLYYAPEQWEHYGATKR